ncbi:hypothetical protein MVEN_00401400 [Mycena venus]|uniref:Methyltransferase domain-containing protein n=1 Tax=Mycena venus TaxID=2733690 RepID=A0A8H6YUZ5_9AGAR|nr:hypothetical protein MVEN_00401400 [Mycena venus]
MSARNPRYIVFILVAVVLTLYLLGPFGTDTAPFPVTKVSSIEDHDLPNRLARSDKIYNKLLLDRKELIKKFGPTPNDVALFPPNKDPWPAYTVCESALHIIYPNELNCVLKGTFSLRPGIARMRYNVWAPLVMEASHCHYIPDMIFTRSSFLTGKWVCGITRVETKPDCIVYSFGINYESSFEAEILANTDHCQIWGYDFSVNSFGPEIPRSQAHRTHFHPYGLAGTDKHGPDDVPKMYTIESLMKMNGHTHIDILKVDIERYEFETLSALIKPYITSGKPLPFGQLQLEIHLWHLSFTEFLTWWETLEEAGLRPFWTEPNLVYQNYNRGGHDRPR